MKVYALWFHYPYHEIHLKGRFPSRAQAQQYVDELCIGVEWQYKPDKQPVAYNAIEKSSGETISKIELVAHAVDEVYP